MNFFNQNSKSSVPCVIPTVSKIEEKSDNKSKNTEKEFSKRQLRATNIKIIGMLLSTVQTHLRLSSLIEFPLKYLILIAYFSESHSYG